MEKYDTKEQQEPLPASKNKDEEFESFINRFNEHLIPFEQEQYLELDEVLPSVHVIGVPRSGTTLLTQLICSYLDVGFINNLIARFWKAPVTGIRLSRKLLGDNCESTFSSEYGKTHRIHEPHEFNYFWSDQLEYEDLKVKSIKEAEKINWERVAHTLKNIMFAFDKPVVFKSFVLGWHARLMQQHLEKTCFVWIRRNPLDNALSLLETREKYFGSKKNWSTLKPQNYESLKNMTPYDQVAAQVYYMEQTYQEQLNQIPDSNYLILRYEELCASPTRSLKAIRDMLNHHGSNVRFLDRDIPALEPSYRGAYNSQDLKMTQEALQSYYSSIV